MRWNAVEISVTNRKPLKKLGLGPGFGSITPLYLVQIKNNQTLNKKGW